MSETSAGAKWGVADGPVTAARPGDLDGPVAAATRLVSNARELCQLLRDAERPRLSRAGREGMLRALGDLTGVIAVARAAVLREVEAEGHYHGHDRDLGGFVARTTKEGPAAGRRAANAAAGLAVAPQLEQALLEGSVPPANAQTLAQALGGAGESQRETLANGGLTRLMEQARRETAPEFGRTVRRWLAATEPERHLEQSEATYRARELHVSHLRDGALAFSGRLDPIAGQAFEVALDAAHPTKLAADDHRTHSQRMADALSSLVSGFLASQHSKPSALARPLAIVHMTDRSYRAAKFAHSLPHALDTAGSDLASAFTSLPDLGSVASGTHLSSADTHPAYPGSTDSGSTDPGSTDTSSVGTDGAATDAAGMVGFGASRGCGLTKGSRRSRRQKPERGATAGSRSSVVLAPAPGSGSIIGPNGRVRAGEGLREGRVEYRRDELGIAQYRQEPTARTPGGPDQRTTRSRPGSRNPRGQHIGRGDTTSEAPLDPTSVGGFGMLDNGEPLSASELVWLTCDCQVMRLVVGADGVPIDVGRTQRTWTNELRHAVHARDGGCAWPGCRYPARWSEIHHRHAWADGGSTSVVNGVTLCRAHHRQVHLHDIRIDAIPGGFAFYDPHNRHIGTTHHRTACTDDRDRQPSDHLGLEVMR